LHHAFSDFDLLSRLALGVVEATHHRHPRLHRLFEPRHCRDELDAIVELDTRRGVAVTLARKRTAAAHPGLIVAYASQSMCPDTWPTVQAFADGADNPGAGI